MKALLATVNYFIAAWNEPEPSRRRGLIATALVEDAVYVAGLCNAKGWDAIDETIAHLMQQLPGVTFRLSSDVLQHNAMVISSWNFAAIDGVFWWRELIQYRLQKMVVLLGDRLLFS